MQTHELTAAALRDVLQEAAGEDVHALAGDWLDRSFEDLGYDSLSVLETISRIERRLGLRLGDSVFAEAGTVRAFLEQVNAQVAGSRVA